MSSAAKRPATRVPAKPAGSRAAAAAKPKAPAKAASSSQVAGSKVAASSKAGSSSKAAGSKAASTAGKAAVAEAPPPPLPPPPEPVEGACRVRYNHYNQEFRLLDNALQWADVDEAYCISYVFEGAFRPRIVDAAGASFQRDAAGAFAPLQDGGAYTLTIDEDEAAEAAATAANPRRAAGVVAAEPVPGVNSASARLTAELKTLSVEELAGQSDRYRELKEARDLEDVLFSG
jgi:hypothetical protein